MKKPFLIKASGQLAIFTRPEFKSERFSYPCITPSAARGLIESVLWKPQISWTIQRIHILKEINWISFRRNEVGSKAQLSKTVIKNGGTPPSLLADKDRVMRNTVALKEVSYAIECNFSLTPKAGKGDNYTKYQEMFKRRLQKGQHFHQPYFGCRECPAHLELLESAPQAIKLDKDLGIMLWDIDYQNQHKSERNTPIFFHAIAKQGIIDVPTSLEQARQSLLNQTTQSC